MSDLSTTATRLVRAAIGGTLTTIWSALLGLFTAPVMIRHLGASEYGVFALITLVSSYLTNLEFGFGHATIRFLAVARSREDTAEEAAVVGNSLLVFIFAAAITTTVTFFGASFIVAHFAHGPAALHGSFLRAIRLGGFVIGVSLMTTLAQAFLQALGRLQTIIFTNWVVSTLMSLTALTLALAHKGLVTIIEVQLAVQVAAALFLYARLIWVSEVPLVPRLARSSFVAMARFAAFVMIAGIGTQLALQGPPAVLAGYATTAQLAAFSVPRTVLLQLDSVVSSASLGFLPFASGASVGADRSAVKKIYLANLRLTLMELAPVVCFLVAFAHPLLRVWVGASFAHEAAVPLAWLAVSSLFWGIGSAASDLARGFGMSGAVAIYTLAGAVATIGLAFLAVPAHHAAGAAFALCVGGGIVTVPFVLTMNRVILNVGASELLRATLGPLCALGLAAGLDLAGAAISPTFVGAIVTGLVGTSIYILTGGALVLDERERSVLLAVVRHRRDRSVQEATAYSSKGLNDVEIVDQMPEPAEKPATANGAAANTGAANEPSRAWRASLALGAEDAVNERAWPGMPVANVMSEHTSRYAFALGLVGGKQVLDLGCGTGYGSEMLSWAAASVRGYDLWQPADAERPYWPGVEQLNYGHDLCAEPLPAADAAVMFEVMEHLPDSSRALEIVFKAVPALICSFPNPDFHGSSHNQYHINDWPLAQVEQEVRRAAEAAGRRPLRLTHLYQPYGSPLIRRGRAPHQAYWIIVADASPTSIIPPIVRVDPWVMLKRRLRIRSRFGLR